MPDLLALIEERLRSRATRMGFALYNAGTRETGGELRLLEYRRVTQGRTRVLLDIFAVTGSPRITAELWSPSDVLRASATATADDVAIRRRTWTVHPAADPETLAGEIADEVGAWLERIEPASPER